MNKDYQKPDFEYIELLVEDSLTDDTADGSIGMEDVPPGLLD